MATRPDTAPCADPRCNGRAELDTYDGQSFMECLECGYAFSFLPLQPAAEHRDTGRHDAPVHPA